jgi:hypothetical protein
MRQYRSSGSVEGAVSNDHSYADLRVQMSFVYSPVPPRMQHFFKGRPKADFAGSFGVRLAIKSRDAWCAEFENQEEVINIQAIVPLSAKCQNSRNEKYIRTLIGK